MSSAGPAHPLTTGGDTPSEREAAHVLRARETREPMVRTRPSLPVHGDCIQGYEDTNQEPNGERCACSVHRFGRSLSMSQCTGRRNSMTATQACDRVVWVTAAGGTSDHAVTSGNLAIGISSRMSMGFVAVCGARFVAAPLVAEPGPRCASCVRTLRVRKTERQAAASLDEPRPHHRMQRWWTALVAWRGWAMSSRVLLAPPR